MLSPERRKQLDDIVLKMAAQNAPQKDVQAIVNDFVGKFNNETTQSAEPQKGLIEQASEIVPNLALGAAKGIASTIKGAANLGEKYLLNPIDQALGVNQEKSYGLQPGETATEKMVPSNITTPANTAQKIGFGAEQIGEFFAPSGIIGKVGKAAEGASKFEKLGALATKAGAEAVGAGGVTALQGGQLNKNAATNALVAGTIPIAGKTFDLLAAPTKQFLSENIAPRIVNSILKPISKEFNFGRNAGAGVVEQGITATSRKQLLNKITAKKQEIGSQIEQALTHPDVVNKTIDINPLLSPIDEAMQKAVKSGEQGLYDRLKAIKDGMTNEFSVVEGKLTPTAQKNLVVSPKEAQLMKRELGEATRWTGQAFDDDVNKVRVKIYQNIDKAIDQTAPGVDKLNSRYANILSAEKSLDRTISIIERQNLVGLKDLGVGAVAGLASSAAHGHLSLTDALYGALGLGANKLAGSALAKTNIARTLGALSPEEKTALSKAIPIIRNVIFGLQSKQ